MFETQRCCPVCRRSVTPTGRRPVVPQHQDRAGHRCPMAGEPYELTEPYRRPARLWEGAA